MNNSLIVSMLAKIYAFLCNCYEHSVFKKICVAIVNFLKKITENNNVQITIICTIFIIVWF